MSKADLKAVVWKEGSWFVAKALGIEVASQGRSKREAVNNLRKLLIFFLKMKT